MPISPPARARLSALAAVGCVVAGCGDAVTVADVPMPDHRPDRDDDQYGLSVEQPRSGPRPCGAKSGLAVSPGLADAAMGLRVMTLYVTNCGVDPLTVEGYPAVTLLDDEWRALDVEVRHGSASIATIEGFDDPPQPVTLAPEESAVASVLWRNTVDDLAGTPVVGAHLDVVPMPDEPAQRVRPHGDVDLGTTGRLGVSAWKSYEATEPDPTADNPE
ncbi:DUF4232 domain-containing protein [Streptomyces sp. B6B3]|uniref:DUF4232 domain-containing protein n=1 Tax=Streptomyces sp. B6B3 TaxID=3153570 RepID=UPI00325CB311